MPYNTDIQRLRFNLSDYRGLKKRITAIRLTQEQATDGTAQLLLPSSPTLDTQIVETSTRGHATDDDASVEAAKDSITQISDRHHGLDGQTGTESDSADHSSRLNGQRPSSKLLSPQSPQTEALPSPQREPEPEPGPSNSQSSAGILRAATLNMGFLPRIKRNTSSRNFRRAGKGTLQWDLAKSIPLKDLIPLLLPVQRAFFEKLDAELDKIETFFVEREKEMRAR